MVVGPAERSARTAGEAPEQLPRRLRIRRDVCCSELIPLPIACALKQTSVQVNIGVVVTRPRRKHTIDVVPPTYLDEDKAFVAAQVQGRIDIGRDFSQ